MNRPQLNSFKPLAELLIQKYERYLPTAFNENLTLLQKVNAIIIYLNDTGKLVNEVVTKWNEVMEWILADGINEKVLERLDDMVTDGTLERLINEEVFGDFNTRLNEFEETQINQGKVITGLKEIVHVDIKDFGGKSDGIADDTTAFINANTRALEKRVPLKLPKGVTKIDASVVKDKTISAIVGDGYTSVLSVTGLSTMKIADKFELKNLKIEHDYSVDNTTSSSGTLFYGLNELDSLVIENVDYEVKNTVNDGSKRGSALVRAHASNVVIENVRIIGARNGITISKLSEKQIENLDFNNIRFINVQTGLYLAGGDITGAGIGTPIKGVRLNNISLVNTLEQRGKFTKINGSDMLMFENVQDIQGSGLYTEYACERAGYFNYCRDVILSDIRIKNSEGYKVSGYVNKPSNIYRYSENVNIDNISLDGGHPSQIRMMILYEIKNVFINGVRISGEFPSQIDSGIELNGEVENFHLSNVNARNILRGILHFNSLYNSQRNHMFKNVYINNVVGTDVVNTSDYNAIRVTTDSAIPDEFIFENFNIENCSIKAGANPFYDASKNLDGLISIDKVNKFRSRNNNVQGFNNINGWLTVGANSKDVISDEKIMSPNLIPKGSYFSGGSVFEYVGNLEAQKGFQRLKASVVSQDNATKVGLVNNNIYGDYEAQFTLEAGQHYTLYWFDGNVKTFRGNFTATSGWLDFVYRGSFERMLGSSNAGFENIPATLGIFVEGGLLRVKNNLDTTQHIQVKINFQTR